MVKPSEEHGPRFYDAYFNKRLVSFVRDKKPQDNSDRILVTLMSFDEVLITEDRHSVIFDKMYFGSKRLSTAYLYILSFSKKEEFTFDLVDNEERQRSYSLKYSSVTRSVEVIDWAEEDLRRTNIPETIRQWFWRQVRNAAYNYFHPWGKWRS
jgi:hypothetical protein